MFNGFVFHHIGIACESISADLPLWEALGYRREDDAFSDPLQGIRGQFMTGGGPRIELLEALNASSSLSPWLKRRVKFYHMGYLVRSLAAALDMLMAGGGIVTSEPKPSAYFGTDIAFIMMPNMALIEVIQSTSDLPTPPKE